MPQKRRHNQNQRNQAQVNNTPTVTEEGGETSQSSETTFSSTTTATTTSITTAEVAMQEQNSISAPLPAPIEEVVAATAGTLVVQTAAETPSADLTSLPSQPSLSDSGTLSSSSSSTQTAAILAQLSSPTPETEPSVTPRSVRFAFDMNQFKLSMASKIEENRALIISLVKTETPESLCCLLQQNKEVLGEFSVTEDTITEQLYKEIRQEAVFQLISQALGNLELMEKEGNMAVLFNIVKQEISFDVFAKFKKKVSQLGLSDLDGLHKVFTQTTDYDFFQSRLSSYYQALLQKRKEIFTHMALAVLDLEFMRVDKIHLLIGLLCPNKTAKECYEALKQCAHALNMPDFPERFNHAVDEEEFISIQNTLFENYRRIEKERENLISKMCVKCASISTMAKNNNGDMTNKEMLNILVLRDTTPAQCHELFKQNVSQFEIHGYSAIFDSLIGEEEMAFLQKELRYQRLCLGIKEKCTIPLGELEENDILRLRITANEIQKSQTVGAYLGITEFDLPREWERQAKFFVHRAVATAILQSVVPDEHERREILDKMRTVEQCEDVWFNWLRDPSSQRKAPRQMHNRKIQVSLSTSTHFLHADASSSSSSAQASPG